MFPTPAWPGVLSLIGAEALAGAREESDFRGSENDETQRGSFKGSVKGSIVL